MKYLLFLVSLSIIACGQKAEKASTDPSEDITDSLQKKIATLDSLEIQCKDFEITLKELELGAKSWVMDQSKSDTREKMQLLEAEKKCMNQIQKIDDYSINELTYFAGSLRTDLDSALMITKEIRTLLPDFASYEDMTNLFVAQVMVEVDGDLDIMLNKVRRKLGTLRKNLQLDKEKISAEIKKKQAVVSH